MLITEGFHGYELKDAGGGERLERFGQVTTRRPDPAARWNKALNSSFWDAADLSYKPSEKPREAGMWRAASHVPESWSVEHGRMKLIARPSGLKQVGVFPEQSANWGYVADQVALAKNHRDESIRLLNLFAYTGAMSIAALLAGASVCHVDSSREFVQWAQENARASGVTDSPIRYIVDDAKAFCAREVRRGKKYDAIVMDPPSFGHGPSGETWKLEKDLVPLLNLCSHLLSDNPLFVLVSFHTAGLEPLDVAKMVAECLPRGHGVLADSLGIRIKSTNRVLPAGSVVRWQ